MLPDLTLPPSLQALLTWFERLLTAPSFRTFCALAAGFLALALASTDLAAIPAAVIARYASR